MTSHTTSSQPSPTMPPTPHQQHHQSPPHLYVPLATIAHAAAAATHAPTKLFPGQTAGLASSDYGGKGNMDRAENSMDKMSSNTSSEGLSGSPVEKTKAENMIMENLDSVKTEQLSNKDSFSEGNPKVSDRDQNSRLIKTSYDEDAGDGEDRESSPFARLSAMTDCVREERLKRKSTGQMSQQLPRKRAHNFRGMGFTGMELDSILDAVEASLPIASHDWEAVRKIHARKYPRERRSAESLRRKFAKLHRYPRSHNDEANHHPPEVVKRARRVQDKIRDKADGIGGNCEGVNDDESSRQLVDQLDNDGESDNMEGDGFRYRNRENKQRHGQQDQDALKQREKTERGFRQPKEEENSSRRESVKSLEGHGWDSGVKDEEDDRASEGRQKYQSEKVGQQLRHEKNQALSQIRDSCKETHVVENENSREDKQTDRDDLAAAAEAAVAAAKAYPTFVTESEMAPPPAPTYFDAATGAIIQQPQPAGSAATGATSTMAAALVAQATGATAPAALWISPNGTPAAVFQGRSVSAAPQALHGAQQPQLLAIPQVPPNLVAAAPHVATAVMGPDTQQQNQKKQQEEPKLSAGLQIQTGAHAKQQPKEQPTPVEQTETPAKKIQKSSPEQQKLRSQSPPPTSTDSVQQSLSQDKTAQPQDVPQDEKEEEAKKLDSDDDRKMPSMTELLKLQMLQQQQQYEHDRQRRLEEWDEERRRREADRLHELRRFEEERRERDEERAEERSRRRQMDDFLRLAMLHMVSSSGGDRSLDLVEAGLGIRKVAATQNEDQTNSAALLLSSKLAPDRRRDRRHVPDDAKENGVPAAREGQGKERHEMDGSKQER